MKNNKGFSLIELIIVIAILSVLTGVSAVGLGYLYSTNVKSSIKKVDSSLQKVQSYTVSKSVGGKDIGLKLKKKADGFYAEYMGIPNLSEEKFGEKNLKVYYMDSTGAGWTEVTAVNDLKVYYDRATGGLQPLSGTGSSAIYISKIRLTTSSETNAADDASKCCTVEISKITGKTTVTVYQ